MERAELGRVLRSPDLHLGASAFPRLASYSLTPTQIGYTGTSNSLLASGIYGIVKVVATALFVFFLVDSLGRKLSLFISAMGMGTLFFIIGALLKSFPPPATPPPGFTPPPASKAMAAMLYIYVCFYSMGWGPLP